MFVHISKKFKLKKSIMFLITVKNLNIILVVYLVKKLIINNVAYTSKGSGVYVLWGWRIILWGWHIRPIDLYVQRAVLLYKII